jgi:hypothetical protein
MRLTWGVALFAVLCLGVACSGDEEAGPSPTSAISETPVTEPTSALTTTPATTSTTTAPTTTAAPTTTIDPTDALIAEIEADLNEGEQALLDGAAAPAAESSRANLARYFTGRSLESLLEFYDVLVAEGFVGRPNPEVASVVNVRSIVEENDGSVLVDFCRIDAGVVIQQLSDGNEIIVNDEITRYEFRVPMVKVDGIWASPGGELLSEEVGVTSCD